MTPTTRMPEKCVYCGEVITFDLPEGHTDGDWYACERCAAMDEPCTCEHCVEPDHDDTVHCCPDCERPNQFGELCHSCASERGEQAYA